MYVRTYLTSPRSDPPPHTHILHVFDPTRRFDRPQAVLLPGRLIPSPHEYTCDGCDDGRPRSTSHQGSRLDSKTNNRPHRENPNGPSRKLNTRAELLAELSLVHLYTAACLYQWDSLPSLAAQVHACTPPDLDATARVQATVRHLVVFSGYGPCLAAMTALKKVDDEMLQRTIPYDTPGKVSSSAGGGDGCGGGSENNADSNNIDDTNSRRGNAFELVYSTLSPKVRNTVRQADPVLENWIQNHLYGDVYSSPGLGMLSKQHLTIAGLVKSNMMEQLYGHALAALRFGGDEQVLKGIVDIVVWWQKKVSVAGEEADNGTTRAWFQELERQGTKSKRVVDMALAKYKRMKEDGDLDTEDAVVNPIGTVCIPSV